MYVCMYVCKRLVLFERIGTILIYVRMYDNPAKFYNLLTKSSSICASSFSQTSALSTLMTSPPSFADFAHLSRGSSSGPAHALEELITSCCTGLCPQYSQRTLELLASYFSYSLHRVLCPRLTPRLSTPIGSDTLRSFLHRSAHDLNISIFRILSNPLKPFLNHTISILCFSFTNTNIKDQGTWDIARI